MIRRLVLVHTHCW